MKKYLFPAALATTLLATSCSDNDMAEPITPDGQKELISLTLGLGDDTRAMAKRASGTPTYDGFKAKTRILMRIQSDDNVDADGNHRYTKTLATAAAETDASKIYSNMSIDDAYKRYWDDAFGRNAYLSVFAVAIPNKTNSDLLPESKLKGSSAGWTTTADDNNIDWTVSASQNATTLLNEDLVYSRNIRMGGTAEEAGRYVYKFGSSAYVPNIDHTLTGDNVFTKDRMRFTLSDKEDPTSPGKFDRGHLIFNHSLSRLTITIKSGEGFIKSGEVFDANNNFKLSDEGVQALGMNTSGTLDVSTGLWADGATTGTITTNPTVEGPTGSKTYASYKTSMQMLPGYAFNNGNNTNVLQFTIDYNTYYITQDLIFDALKENAANNGLSTSEETKYTMEQGKNYVLTITVKKTKIESLTATLADWVDVAAKEKPLDNSYVTLNLKNTEGKACEEDFDLYRLGVGDGKIHTSETGTTADAYKDKWFGNYTDKASLSKAADYETSKNWTTEWYFEDNKTFYHFRTVNKDTEILGDEDDTADYFAIHDGPISGTNEVDPHWGAPLKNYPGTDKAASKYNIAEGDDEGYTDIIYEAIGSTKDAIAIQEFHMLSEIRVIVKTKAAADGGVKLYDDKGTVDTNDDVYTTVTLYQFAQNGQVKMGNGFVTAQEPYTHEAELTQPTTFFKTDPTVTNAFTWRVVPQTLSRGKAKTDKVAIKIQTPDNNLYYCIEDLSQIPVNGTSNPINYWKPNHCYTYTFIISKKGIDQITCTVANWIPVIATDKDINLED